MKKNCFVALGRSSYFFSLFKSRTSVKQMISSVGLTFPYLLTAVVISVWLVVKNFPSFICHLNVSEFRDNLGKVTVVWLLSLSYSLATVINRESVWLL